MCVCARFYTWYNISFLLGVVLAFAAVWLEWEGATINFLLVLASCPAEEVILCGEQVEESWSFFERWGRIERLFSCRDTQEWLLTVVF